ncbi:MAG: hypothetical protein QOH37_2320, partial [Nocardioidaceae bacterium]|nr:hypothetical protein [Nocardioidaceae bacterium]
MTISPRPLEHPLLAVVRVVEEALDETSLADPVYLPTEQKRELLVGLTRVVDRLQARRAGVLAVADDVAAQEAARSAGSWLAGETHTSPRELAAVERVGAALGRRWGQVAEAVGGGRSSWEQAGVLVRALEALPSDLDAELVAKAEAHLVAEAGHFGPRELARLGRRVLEVVAPEVADAAEAAALAEEERRSWAVTRLSFRPRADGTTDLHARLPDHVASRLRAYQDAFTSPRRTGAAALGDVDLLPLPRRRGEAFCTLLEQIPADRLPAHGGTATSVMVTIDLDTLRSGLGLGETSTGEFITAGEARRLACTASIVPVVLGGAGETLDLGRARRLFSPAQRKALAIRDRCCRAEGCDIPAAWCEAHHAHSPWSQGGRTDLAHGLLLCSFH